MKNKHKTRIIEIQEAEISWIPHPYVTCPYCQEEQEVQQEGEGIDYECCWCHGIMSYSTVP